MIILQTTDFETGFNQLALSIQTTPILQDYIDKYEELFIKQILGVELGELFIEDIKGEDSDSSAISPRFQKILDPFIEQDSRNSDKIWVSKGMKETLASLVFYKYVFEGQAKISQSGVILNQAEVATIQSPENAARFAEVRWNDALESIDAIQWWCGWEDTENYLEYEGIIFRPNYSPLL